MPDHVFAKELEQAVNGPETGSDVVLASAPGATLARRFRHNAPLVTQLMAVKLDAPQARARRRAGTEEGVAAYGAAGERIRLGRRRMGASVSA